MSHNPTPIPRCWRCGIEAPHVTDVTTFSSAKQEWLPRWPPPTDHEHAEHPPTPGQLEQAGHEALMRIVNGT